MADDAAFTAALDAWRSVLGADGVATSAEALFVAQRATLAAPSGITAVLHPTDRAQVAPCLAVATQYGVPVHAVSRGCNWGYGSRLPQRGRAVLLSMARLDRVLRFDEAMATVRVEPGVSFRALADHMAAAGSRLLPPSTGSGEHTSVLGNVMERGIGKGLYEDMAAHACGFEVVLPTGRTLYTGPDGLAAGAARVASGPDLRDLFVQSNLGIVTAMDLWLHPAPRHRQLVWARVQTDGGLAETVNRLRPLLQRNDPWLRPELVTDHRARTQGSGVDDPGQGWLAAVWIWGDGEQDLAWRRQSALDVLSAAGSAPACVGDGESGASVTLGYEGLRGAYSAKPGGMPPVPDPDRDRCGVIWVAPALPMLGEVVARTTRTATSILARHGFGPAISLRAMDGRMAKAIIGLFSDRDEPGADERSTECASALRQALRAEGLRPYRLGVLDGPEQCDPGRADLLRGIKRVTDPSGILAPGRYIV